jgi:hypothetical protein
MTSPPAFFLPAATPDNQEKIYGQLAQWCRVPVPDLQNRIYSIGYNHNGDQWIATVGECLRGVRKGHKRSRGRMVEYTEQLSDPAIVLAIFSGIPYMVVTNHRIGNYVGSAWENPFLAGRPTSITYFSSSE